MTNDLDSPAPDGVMPVAAPSDGDFDLLSVGGPGVPLAPAEGTPSSSTCPCHGEPWIVRARKGGGILRQCPVKQAEAKQRYAETHVRVFHGSSYIGTVTAEAWARHGHLLTTLMEEFDKRQRAEKREFFDTPISERLLLGEQP